MKQNICGLELCKATVSELVYSGRLNNSTGYANDGDFTVTFLRCENGFFLRFEYECYGQNYPECYESVAHYRQGIKDRLEDIKQSRVTTHSTYDVEKAAKEVEKYIEGVRPIRAMLNEFESLYDIINTDYYHYDWGVNILR